MYMYVCVCSYDSTRVTRINATSRVSGKDWIWVPKLTLGASSNFEGTDFLETGCKMLQIEMTLDLILSNLL